MFTWCKSPKCQLNNLSTNLHADLHFKKDCGGLWIKSCYFCKSVCFLVKNILLYFYVTKEIVNSIITNYNDDDDKTNVWLVHVVNNLVPLKQRVLSSSPTVCKILIERLTHCATQVKSGCSRSITNAPLVNRICYAYKKKMMMLKLKIRSSKS